ncbi:MAG TPA: hypothetical protein VER35_00075 [Candidatus Limnocylindrales bacterium]|nr:hypothetical protein [Candidatus Limnocylindrales bacterium]
MLENYLADLKACLTASPIVRDIEINDEFITSVSGFIDCTVVMIDEFFMLLSILQHPAKVSTAINIRIICKKMVNS